MRVVTEGPGFRNRVKWICDNYHVDPEALERVIAGVVWGLGHEKSGSSIMVPGTALYLAKTRRGVVLGKVVPELDFLHRIREDGQVELLSVKAMDVLL